MQSLKDTIMNARKFNSDKKRALCLGNTSSDMDSVVGSMLMSWLLSSKQQ